MNTGTEYFQTAIEYVLEKIDANLATFTDKVPASASRNLIYDAIDNTYWTASFWNGMLWLAYELTGAAKYRQVAEAQLRLHQQRLDQKINIETHDLGFLYTLSCVAAYRLTGNETAKEYALRAARHLTTRYLEKPRIIQAWGRLDDPKTRGQMIIDCLFNLPLLYWASEVTGDERFYEIAANHAEQASRYLVRTDGSSYHTYFMSVETGDPIIGKTHQGYSDDSCWARGQAWGIYGFPLTYRYTGAWNYIETAKQMADYFLARLPEDNICYWDLVFTSGWQERDSSAAAIAVCGLQEIAKHLPVTDPAKLRYEKAVLVILKSLTENYLTTGYPKSNGILMHGVQHRPKQQGIDECCIWGDYFYFEAMVRMIKDWKPYW